MTTLLLDSHALVWFLNADPRFGENARQAIENADSVCLVSAATAYEISYKVRIGKWPEADELARGFTRIVTDQGFARLPVTLEHAVSAGLFTAVHRDPFDRLLAAQAMLENIPVVTADQAFQQFGVQVLW